MRCKDLCCGYAAARVELRRSRVCCCRILVFTVSVRTEHTQVVDRYCSVTTTYSAVVDAGSTACYGTIYDGATILAYDIAYGLHFRDVQCAHKQVIPRFAAKLPNSGISSCTSLFTARRSYATNTNTNTNKNLYSAKFVDKTRQRRYLPQIVFGVLGVLVVILSVCPSVRPSVCHTRAL